MFLYYSYLMKPNIAFVIPRTKYSLNLFPLYVSMKQSYPSTCNLQHYTIHSTCSKPVCLTLQEKKAYI